MKNRTLLILIFSCFIFSSVNATQWTVESLPNPKNSPSKNFVSNPDDIISEEAVNTINSVCLQLESELKFSLVYVLFIL